MVGLLEEISYAGLSIFSYRGHKQALGDKPMTAFFGLKTYFYCGAPYILFVNGFYRMHQDLMRALQLQLDLYMLYVGLNRLDTEV